MSENMNQRRGDARATWPLCWVEVDSLDALRRLVRDDAYAAAFQNLAQYRDALLQHLKKWAVAEAARQASVRTWRQRIGVSKDWPLHAPNDVERAMVAEIAELRLVLGQAAGKLERPDGAVGAHETAAAIALGHPELSGRITGAHACFSEAMPPGSLTSVGHGHVYKALQAAIAHYVAHQPAPTAEHIDAIVTGLYRRFKDWSKRGFGADDVTWCEVKADVVALIAAGAAERGAAARTGCKLMDQWIAGAQALDERAARAAAVKPWQQRVAESGKRECADLAIDCLMAEVADLRTLLKRPMLDEDAYRSAQLNGGQGEGS